MPGPFIPVWALSRSQAIRVGNGPGKKTAPQLTKNPSSAALPTPLLVDLSDGTSRRDLAHHLAIGSLIPAHGLRLTSSLAANSAAITTTATLVNNLAIPANALNVGATVRITVQGVTSATGNVTILSKWGTVGTLAGDTTTLVTQTAAGATGGGAFDWNSVLTVQAVGAGTNGKVVTGAQFSGHGNTLAVVGSTAQIGLDTTVASFIDVGVSVSAGNVVITNSLIEFLDSAY